MYQADLFESSVRRNAKFLASGAFSSVYRMTNGKIVKVGQNDGTRNWLEFCMLHREAGTLMPMMPEVYCVTAVGAHNYMATMEEYRPWHECVGELACSIAFINARNAFSEYLGALTGYDWQAYEVFNDIHRGNIMVCPRRGTVITDPSAFGYRTNSHCIADFTLQ